MNKNKRNMGIFFLGFLISGLGTVIYNFAIGLYVLQITGSGLTFSLTIMLSMIPRIIISPIAGILADKFSRKKFIILMDFLSSALLFTIFLILKKTELTLPIIYITTFLLSTFNAFFSVNIDSLIPNLVDDDKLVKLNSIDSFLDSLIKIVGPIIGGSLYLLFSIKDIIVVNAISFFISAILEIFFKIDISEKVNLGINKVKNSFFSDIKSSIIYIKNNKIVLFIIIDAMAINFIFMNLSIVIPYYCVNVIKLSAINYSIIQSSLPFGMIIASLLFAIKKTNKILVFSEIYNKTLLIAFTHIALFILTLFSINNTYNNILLFLTIFIFGYLVCFIDILMNTSLQKNIVDEFRGRVSGLVTSLSQILSPIAVLIYGLLIENFSVSTTILFSTTLFLVISFFFRKEKKYDKLIKRI
ncbi:MAG: MFS transporter [Pleomorphochaeta sp.]